ncbi:glycosyltransferase family 2 protein [Nocardioides KLBMP 9356]|uniref:Glycosyltransferase family 2 protein n=1 Tax=Nocardioides potassii TaxID=2911371 RepID=A0ABS9H832_9ACTN|nr:glycosyltransferase family 2 protein [Nocardioides potassii]MCF6376278.1 glycosyltransferase family 2 protein [Nocardioides potassii]
MSDDLDSQAALSIVIPHYGDPALTLSLIDLLRAQRTERPMQLIVADDCSPMAFPQQHGVDVVRLPVNRGFGTAVNRGAELATHPLLMILNSDVVPEPNFIDDLVAAVRPHMPCVASPNLVEGERRGTTASAAFPSAMPQVLNAMMPVVAWRQRRPGRTRVTHGDEQTAWVAGACMLVRTEDYRRVGGFDEGFYMYSEDIDLCRRLKDVGVRSFHAETVELVHAHGGSSDLAKVSLWAAASRFRYAEKWGFRGRLATGLAAASLVNLLYNAARRASGRDVRPIERLHYEWSMLRYGWSRQDPRDGR